MDVLVIGSGGREHALIHGLKRSSKTGKIYALPGNGGINRDAIGVEIDASDFTAIADFCKKQEVVLVVVGPEAPLVDGIVDYLESQNIRVFGPNAKASQLEGSKAFMKAFAQRHHLPTAAHASFTNKDEAKAYIRQQGVPIVVKTDGLAAGKGVIIAHTEQEALTAVDEMFGGKFGAAGNTLVIESFLEGEEASFFALCDGETAIAFGSAQDHKAVGEGDTGPNTGGMGTYSPAPVVTNTLHQRIMDEIITPTMKGLKADGISYRGFLFAGIMVDPKGNPLLLEFNIRLGDPEAQVLIPRLESDLLDLLNAACDRTLSSKEVRFSQQTALCVVMAAKGYPGSYEKGSVIGGLDAIEALDNTIVFHAGTKASNGNMLSNGGRVLGVTGIGNDIIAAQQAAYKAVDALDWPEGFCRRDIGWRAVERLKLAS